MLEMIKLSTKQEDRQIFEISQKKPRGRMTSGLGLRVGVWATTHKTLKKLKRVSVQPDTKMRVGFNQSFTPANL